MKVKQIDNTVLTVTQLDKAARFYHEVFDMPLLDSTDTMQTLRCSHQILKLQKKNSNSPLATTSKSATDSVDLCILVGDQPSDILNHLKSYFVDIVSESFNQENSENGLTSIYIRDYDNNLIKIITHTK